MLKMYKVVMVVSNLALLKILSACHANVLEKKWLVLCGFRDGFEAAAAWSSS